MHSTPEKGSDTRMLSTTSTIRSLFGKNRLKPFFFSPHTWPGSLIIGTISISKYMEHSSATLWNVKYAPNTVAENIITVMSPSTSEWKDQINLEPFFPFDYEHVSPFPHFES